MKNTFLNILLILVSTLLTLIALELGVRIFSGDFGTRNFREQKIALFRSAYPAAFDATLGWVPKAGFNSRDNIWATKVNILPHGIRANGQSFNVATPPSRPIVTVGDSFTFGDQVSDDETWPAHLEQLSGVPVINGGVFGYGIDQSYLRAQQLVERYQPRALIFGFIQEDIDRCGLSLRNSAAKPYFILENGRLALKNTPLPHPAETPASDNRDIRHWLGYSLLAHNVMMKAFRSYWIQADWWQSTVAHNQADAVACHIFRDLAEFSRQRELPVFLFVQYKKKAERDAKIQERLARLRDCAVSPLTWVDLRPGLELAREQNRYDRLFDDHMTAAGNRLAAEEVFAALQNAEIVNTGK